MLATGVRSGTISPVMNDSKQRIRSVLALLCALSLTSTASADPEIFRGPYLQRLQPTSVEIVWVMTEPLEDAAILLTSPSGEETSARVDGTLGCEPQIPDGPRSPPVPDAACYRVRFEGLSPESEFSYEIRSAGETLGERRAFRTPPSPGGGVVRMVVKGDSGSTSEQQFALARIMTEIEPHGYLHVGDLDYMGDTTKSVFTPYRDLLSRACMFPARGNHDLENSLPFSDLFFFPGLPDGEQRGTYSFDWGPAHFLVIDANDGGRQGVILPDNLAWIDADLAAADESGIQWVIVTLHYPIFSTGPYALDDDVIDRRNQLTEVFDRHRVDFVFVGHEHLYERSYPIRTRDERCENLDHRPMDPIPDLPRCYDLANVDEDPHYVAPDGTIYITSGGGGHTPYFEAASTPDGKKFVDKAFSAGIHTIFQIVELTISPAMIEGKVWQEDGNLFESFSVARHRAIRGDVNVSGATDLADAVSILGQLFLGDETRCFRAGNVNGDDEINIGDAVTILCFLFRGGPPPDAPYPDCGPNEESLAAWCSENGC